MRRNKIIAIVLSAAVFMGVAAGCKKEESQEPIMLYYDDAQGGDASMVTLASETAPSQTQGGEILAPIIADRTQTNNTAATTATSETSETSSSETSATTTAENQEGQTGDQPADVPSVSGSHVTDNAGVIGDESAVNAAMSSFESNTGVSPAIITIRDSRSGDDFRQYARDLYSSNFSDQNHVLVVYQLTPQGTWSWTCVFGSDTGSVFTQDTINTFQSDLTSAFSSSSVDSALVNTFNNAQGQT